MSNAELLRREKDIPELRRRLQAVSSSMNKMIITVPSSNLQETLLSHQKLQEHFNY